ncbi:MAG: hypothetical protein LBO81_06590 [Clostridiales Family XIII bacterium]|jgi:hypothetical protein|nr:hypothetical protein [Clostridiales Family XIII bacterium]
MARVFREKKSGGTIRMFFFVVAALALLIAIWRLADALGANQDEEQMKIAQEAVLRATVQCYSIEGRYPPGLDYLEENYGLALDREKYVYYYQAVAENIMPNVRLFALGE